MKLMFDLLPFKQARSHYGVHMINNIKDATYRFCMVGAYGHFIESQLKNQKQSFVFIDIGSNQGLFSLIAAQNSNCQRVFALEPNPPTFSFLVGNIKINPNNKKIVPLCGAIGAAGQQELIPFSVAESHSGGANMMQKSGNLGFEALSINPNVMAPYIEKFSNSKIIIKIDVEGAEIIVLNALKSTLFFDSIYEIIIELNDMLYDASHSLKVINTLNQFGFEMVEKTSDCNTSYDALFRRP